MFDPYQMIASAQRLTREGVKMQEYPQTLSNLTESSQNLFDLIKGRNFSAALPAETRDSAVSAVRSRAVSPKIPPRSLASPNFFPA
jgi:hypothetical protein